MNREKIYIFGHKNPDSDSICSAIGYAEYKRGNGEIEPIPIRLGEINRETKYILDYFGVKYPELMKTVRLSVEDLHFDNTAPVSQDISIGMALNLMNKNSGNSLPVVDENEQLIGMVTVSDIIQSYIDVWDNSILGKSDTGIENIIDTLAGIPLNIPKEIKRFDGKILVLAMELDHIKDYIESHDIVICGDRKDIQRAALETDISLMIISGGGEIDRELREVGEKNNIAIISTPHDTFTASRLITQSIPVKHVMTSSGLVEFNLDDLVDDVKVQMSQTRYRSYPVTDHENKVVGTISRYHLISSMKKKVILVDHNERSQSIDGLEDAEILEIIDHHRVADVFTGSPIYFRNEPVGSTCTIVASIMFENGRIPSKKIAGILAAGIISDTLLFRSPTSTQVDKMVLNRLAKIADMDVEKFALDMFKAGTSLIGRTPEEILSQDLKSFNINDFKIGIAQVYTMDPESLEGMRDDLIAEMDRKKDTLKYHTFMLVLTDIFKEASEVLIVGENKEAIANAFNKKLENNSFYADVVSRKKQIVPPITNAINEIQDI